MSKRIVLKSVLALVMVGFVLSFASCQKDEKKIVGTWLLEKVEVVDFACSNPLQTALLKPIIQQAFSGSGSEIEFTKEGKMISSYGSDKEVSSYKVNDKKLTITNSYASEVYDLSFPDKKTMHWERNMSKDDLEDLSEELEDYAYWYEIPLNDDVKVTKCNIRFVFIKR